VATGTGPFTSHQLSTEACRKGAPNDQGGQWSMFSLRRRSGFWVAISAGTSVRYARSGPQRSQSLGSRPLAKAIPIGSKGHGLMKSAGSSLGRPRDDQGDTTAGPPGDQGLGAAARANCGDPSGTEIVITKQQGSHLPVDHHRVPSRMDVIQPKAFSAKSRLGLRFSAEHSSLKGAMGNPFRDLPHLILVRIARKSFHR